MVEAATAKTHITPVRVYFEDTDAGGIVYYANYLKFAERARTEMMRDLSGGQYAQMLAEGVGFVVRRCIVDYEKPAKLDDLLEVHSRALHVGAASLAVEQTVRRCGKRLVAMEVKLGCVDAQGRATRMPSALREIMSQFL